MTEHDKWRQRFEELVAQRGRELGHEPSRGELRAILKQIDSERAAELEAMSFNADAELGDDDLAILDAMGEGSDDEPTRDELLADELD